MNSYLAKDHRETLKSLNKFAEYLTLEGRKYQLSQKDSKASKKDTQNYDLMFSQVINCLVLEEKTEVDIISSLKQLYE
jgi:hypothetical protein